MTRIDSPANPRVVSALRAIRQGEALLLEGPRMLGEAIAAGTAVDAVFHVARAEDETALRAAARRGAELVTVSPRVLEKLSALPSSRVLVALARPPARRLEELELPAHGLAVLLDGVQDPANVGAILRSAEAFGAACAVLTSECAGPFGPRALRASAASALRLPLAAGVSPEEAVAWVAARGARLAGADAHAGSLPGKLEGAAPLVLAIGSEGHGLSGSVAAALSLRLRIPMSGAVESLNAAVAAGVLLYVLSSRISAEKR
jgi:RNA methyltransferase, TrmH family